MIGQENLVQYIHDIKDRFPGFVVIIGSKGSGKRTLAKIMAKELNALYSESGIKVDEIRDVINTAYTVSEKTLYCIADTDTMRSEAKNAMLKITEEPPKNAYFVMTVQDDSSLLDTIKSRALILNMGIYSNLELKSYFWSKHNEGGEEVDLICDIADTPYEVDKLVEYGKGFYDFVELVLNNIATVQSANAFKSANKLAIKDDNGFDLKLFFKVFTHICTTKLLDNPEYYAKGILVTTPCISKVSKLGVNKQQVYDSWVFSIREAWNGYN